MIDVYVLPIPPPHRFVYKSLQNVFVYPDLVNFHSQKLHWQTVIATISGMKDMFGRWTNPAMRMLCDDEGAVAVEYALVVAMLSVGTYVGLHAISENLSTSYASSNDTVLQSQTSNCLPVPAPDTVVSG